MALGFRFCLPGQWPGEWAATGFVAGTDGRLYLFGRFNFGNSLPSDDVSVMALLRYRASFCSSLSQVTAETWYEGRQGNNDLYAFDRANAACQWTELAPTGTLPMKRFGAGVAFSAGRVYVLGGRSGA